jgi:hypothetical protein
MPRSIGTHQPFEFVIAKIGLEKLVIVPGDFDQTQDVGIAINAKPLIPRRGLAAQPGRMRPSPARRACWNSSWRRASGMIAPAGFVVAAMARQLHV